MTDHETNEKIAELIGFHNTVGLMKRYLWYRPDARGYTANESDAGRYTLEEAKDHEYLLGEEPVTIHKFSTPKFNESLDACRLFELTLDPVELSDYGARLRWIVTHTTEVKDRHPDTGRIPDGRYYCATARERCDAFLQLKGEIE